MSPKEISQASSGYERNIKSIKGILRGFSKGVGAEAKEAYLIGMYMIEHQRDVLEKMYGIKVSNLEGLA